MKRVERREDPQAQRVDTEEGRGWRWGWREGDMQANPLGLESAPQGVKCHLGHLDAA